MFSLNDGKETYWFDDLAAMACWVTARLTTSDEVARVLLAAQWARDDQEAAGTWAPSEDFAGVLMDLVPA